jgi:hypothetical protein
MLDCCSRSGDWVLAQEILKQMKLRKSLEYNPTICTSAMMACTNGGEPLKALEIYSEFKNQPKTSNTPSKLVDYPLYSALLYALYRLPTGHDSGIKSLEILQEMTKRHIKLSVYIVTLVISCLDKEGLFDSAMILFGTAQKNGMFQKYNLALRFQNIDNEPLENKPEESKDDRRIDLRKSSLSMIRVILRSIINDIRLADSSPVDDLIIILGNSNKSLADEVVSIFESTILPDYPQPVAVPIRVQKMEGDRLIRVPAKSFKTWLRELKQLSPSRSSKPSPKPAGIDDIPLYRFKTETVEKEFGNFNDYTVTEGEEDVFPEELFQEDNYSTNSTMREIDEDGGNSENPEPIYTQVNGEKTNKVSSPSVKDQSSTLRRTIEVKGRTKPKYNRVKRIRSESGDESNN